MNSGSSPSDREQGKPGLPTLVYDGDCGFCRRWIARWKAITGDLVEYAPFQEVAARFPQIPIENFKRAVQLILPSGETFAGAQAVFRTLAFTPGQGWMLWAYEHIPGAAGVSERAYSLVARHRPVFSKLSRILAGEIAEAPSYVLTRSVFLRFLGLIYFIAFASISTQILGLVGSRGILPAADFSQAVKESFGSSRYWLFPTLTWWTGATDAWLRIFPVAGAALSGLVVLGIAPIPVSIALWALYLSLVTMGQDFTMFQWDSLLLETGFLAMFLAPARIRPRPQREREPSRLVLWLLRWLLFRLILSSGISKLLSGDPTWRSLTALDFHYETQPLPTPFGWVMHQLPDEFQKFSVVIVFVVELAVPFLIFSPRRARLLGGGAMIVFQLLIAATGNYTFFNLSAIALCLLLFDDASYARVFRWRFGKRMENPPARRSEAGWRYAAALALAVMIIPASLADIPGSPLGQLLPAPGRRYLRGLGALHIVDRYGLFAVMTTSRPEIVVQGSNDGKVWLDYEFKYKPGDVTRPPRWVAPHQPRLDWQMWFAALSSYQENPWFANFMRRILQGSPPVLALLAKNPFPDAPPHYLRALVYEYHFTDIVTQRATGAWWQRKLIGAYFPTVALR